MPLRKPFSSGLQVHPIVPYLVPEFDEREAAAAAHIPWDRWDDMARDQRVGVVAWNRSRRLLEIHASDAMNSRSPDGH